MAETTEAAATTTATTTATTPADQEEDDAFADAFADLTEEDRERIKREHDEFSRAARHFNHPADVYLLDLVKWKAHVRDQHDAVAKDLADMPAVPDPDPDDTTRKPSAVIERMRGELAAELVASEELMHHLMQLEAVFKTITHVKTMHDVACVMRYTLQTPLFSDTLLHNETYERVRQFAQWALQLAKNLAYLTIKEELVPQLPETPELPAEAGPASRSTEEEEAAAKEPSGRAESEKK